MAKGAAASALLSRATHMDSLGSIVRWDCPSLGVHGRFAQGIAGADSEPERCSAT